MNNEPIGLGEPPREGLRDRVLALRSLDLFQGLDDDGLLLLAEHARPVRYEAGETIIVDGGPPRAAFLVLEGEVELTRSGRVNLFEAGRGFGFLPLLAGETSGAGIARTASRILEIPAPAFASALDENFSLLRGALMFLGGAVLQARHNLPADPDAPPALALGEYREAPRTLVDKLIELRSSPFGYMNVEALAGLARNMVEVRFAQGEILWRANDVSSYSLHIDYGRVRCTSTDGRHVDVGQGYTLGVVDVWANRLRAYHAVAETPIVAARIERESFLSLLESHTEIGIEILRGFARSILASHVRE